MSFAQIFSEAGLKDLFLMFLVFFWWPLFFGTLYFMLFKKLPFRGFVSDMKFLKHFLTDPPTGNVVGGKDAGRRENPDDFWDDEQAHTNGRPTVRHPKNVDRAHWGGAERFHHGGGENS